MQSFSIRLPDDVATGLRDLASATMVPINRLVTEAVRDMVTNGSQPPQRESLPVPRSGCTHPKELRRIHSWGTTCECGARVR